MRKISLLIDAAGIKDKDIKETGKRLLPEIERVSAARTTGYTTNYCSINLPADQERYNHVKDIVTAQQALKPAILVVIGIGGSHLGALAVKQALLGQLYNELEPKLRVYFVDSVDQEHVHTVIDIVKTALHAQQNVCINVVTKSGTTTETIANFLVFLDLIKKFHPLEYKDHIVVTTDYESKLWTIAQQQGFALLEVPQKVGGRFSVFSAVGLFPLGMLGIDTAALMRGAQDMLDDALSDDIVNNPAALSAIVKYLCYQNKIPIHDLFVFSSMLEGVAIWYRQLMGESIGKTQEVGITPTVSVGTADLHSVGQLYLGGPRDKLTTFVRVQQPVDSVIVPEMPAYDQLVPHIGGKKLSEIMAAIYQGTVAAYRDERRPFMQLIMPQNSAYYIGQVLQLYMIEIMYLGFLLEVNPFNQPHVELYKERTRKILAP